MEKFDLIRAIRSIMRVIGIFAFAQNLPEKDFIDAAFKNNSLPSFNQVTEDFSADTLSLQYWELSLVFITEVNRQLHSKPFLNAKK